MQSILIKKVSSLFSLTIIILLAVIVGVVILRQAQKLTELRKPLPFYISTSTTAGWEKLAK